MEIKEYTDFNFDAIKQLYDAVGWQVYTKNMPALREGYKRSLKILAAYDQDQLLGIIRAVGDGATIFLSKISWSILLISDKESAAVWLRPCSICTKTFDKLSWLRT